MPAKYKDYPIYTYDEPVIYSDFSGGINTDPSNEHLKDNELRNALNVHFMSGALVKRNGAKLISRFKCDDTITNIQGVFLFTYKATYLIVAANGKLYSGIYSTNSDIELSRLRIYFDSYSSDELYNPLDQSVGLEEYQTEQENVYHKGFIYSYITETDSKTGEKHIINYNLIGDFLNLTNTTLYKGEVFKYSGAKYKVLSEVPLVCRRPDLDYKNEYWIEILNPTDIEKRNAYLWLYSTKQYTTDTYVFLDCEDNKRHFYKCLRNHTPYNVLPTDTNLFEELTDTKELIFQNYKSIEAVTFNNKLYITTGTRFIEVYIKSNELYAGIVKPHLCNNTEITKIGYNYISPYPEYCRETQYETVTTSIGNLLAVKTKGDKYILKPMMNFQMNDSESDYLYRWEKNINGIWYTIHRFKDQIHTDVIGGETIQSVIPITSITVSDANLYNYRVTFAKSFENEMTYINAWDYDINLYKAGDYVTVNNTVVYKCLIQHTPSNINWDIQDKSFQVATTKHTYEEGEETKTQQAAVYWEKISEEETLDYYSESTKTFSKANDWKIDKVTGDYFGQASSVLFKNLDINDTYNIIQSCTKIHIDGNKFLLYGDNYNSGQWFKTIINQPGYITDRGCLSFKTTKNEELIKIVSFQGTLIIFANTKNLGGSIHQVTGNGDDYNAEDGYYSPYKREIKNTSITCDNPDSIQICDNYLFFKYFDTIYYINSSSLSNEVFTLTSCNDRLKHVDSEIEIPWTDNDCISIVTKDYYGLMWKEKYTVQDGEITLSRPAILMKLYYKIVNNINNTYVMPWLRDTSEYFNVDKVIYINGLPVLIYKNSLISFSDDSIKTDLGKIYPVVLKLKAYDCGYPGMWKLLSSINLMFHRAQSSDFSVNIKVRNEGKYILLDNSLDNTQTQNLKSLFAGSPVGQMRLGTTIVESKLFNTSYKFPYLLADVEITSENEKDFSLSSVTFMYTTIDTPDTNPYDLYKNIIRKKED